MLTVEVPVPVLIRLRVARPTCRGSGSVAFNGRIARQEPGVCKGTGKAQSLRRCCGMGKAAAACAEQR